MMITIPDYKIIQQIYESSNSLVYRGLREEDDLPVILKVLKEDYPTPTKLTQYRQEYDITRNLNIEGVIKAYGLEKYQNTLVIILEDFGGESLARLMRNSSSNGEPGPLVEKKDELPPASESLFLQKEGRGQTEILEFLSLAVKISEALGEIHAANVIHKDINPSNIILNPATGQVKIIDFGISTVLPRENPILKSPNQLEGTLAYISPEQTGRMNRVIDYRTDFYSLGVTFYELLTQRLPFETEDVMELLHCHLAKQSVPPHRLNSELPEAISKLVMKLLEKTAEARYQGIWGLKADLQECEARLAQGQYEIFPLGKQDHSGKFQPPQKLYGREHEIETLLAAFERVGQGRSEMMLVAGYSGIGKSVLVQEIYKPITQKRGYFITGKFDQLQRNIPYAAFVKAFADLMRQLFTEHEAQLTQWKKKILAAVGPNGQVIIEVIPEMELITGKQPDVPELPPVESQNRFNLVFRNFIKVFTQTEHPLVIFLDDLQWADSASLNLIQLLMAATDIYGLFLIGAYRNNEVSAAHPLILTLQEIKKFKAVINYISLPPLELRHVKQVVSDALQCKLEKGQSLAELVRKKTDGNPFFMNEFLKSLYAEGLLTFNSKQGVWQWDLQQIQARGFTENVVDLIVGKIRQLPVNTQQALKLAACIGNRFDLAILATVLEKAQQETAADLREAILDGQLSIVSTQSPTKLTLTMDNWSLITECRFIHDRIQHAAYFLIPKEQKQAIHHRIGKLLLQNIPLEKREKKIFAIVDQLNVARELINQQSERDELVKLNLIAGRKAKASAAYQSAFDYLSVSFELLDRDSWQTQYKLTLVLHEQAAEAAYLNGCFEQLEKWTEAVLQQAKTTLDKVKTYEIRSQAFQAQGLPKESLNIGLQVLELLGVKFPKLPGKGHILFALLKTKLALSNKRIEHLVNLREMTEPKQRAIMKILADTSVYAYVTNPKLFSLIILKMVRLSVNQGNCPESAVGYGGYAIFLCGYLGDIETGYQFGRLALAVLHRFNVKESQAKLGYIYYALVRPWKHHLRESSNSLLEFARNGLDAGELEFAGYSINESQCFLYFCGQELSKIDRNMRSWSNAIYQLKQKRVLDNFKIEHLAILTLMGYPTNPCQLIGEFYDERIMLPQHIGCDDKTTVFVLYYNKLLLCYLLEAYPQALEQAIQAERCLEAVIGFAHVRIFYFYDSLVRLALYRTSTKKNQQQYRIKVRANQKKMKKWAHHAPMNHLHKFYLVEAEQCRVFGQDEKAMGFYDQAIALAKKHEYLNEEALAHELAAKFYFAKGKDKIAQIYFRDAHYAYTLWGAKAKVKHLETRYPQFFKATQPAVPKRRTITVSATLNVEPGSALDLKSVLKASQTIAGELELNLEKLMRIVIENAGAQRGFLLLEKNGEWFVEAEGEIDKEEETMPQSIPLSRLSEDNERLSLPATLINYAAHSKENVVLHDAAREGRFSDDPHISTHKIKSALCMPLFTQEQLTGLLYLENNLTTGAFTPDRLEMLNLLSSQIAMSIKNDSAYKQMVDSDIKNTRVISRTCERFVPHGFLSLLDRQNLSDIQAGDKVFKEMTVLFSRMHGLARISENPREDFDAVNAWLGRMEAVIQQYQGIMDKYMGDAIMALFPSPDDAIQSSLVLLRTLADYNRERQTKDLPPLSMKLGLDTGQLMLGVIGDNEQMETMVISEVVNTASQLASLSKADGAVISENTYARLQNASQYAIRAVDKIKAEGKPEPTAAYEVINSYE